MSPGAPLPASPGTSAGGGGRTRWPVIGTLVLVLVAAPAAAASAAEGVFYGLGMFGATQFHDDPVWHTSENFDWREIHANPVLGRHLSERWDAWLEGNLGYVDWEEVEDSVEVGLSLLTSYDVLSHKAWGLYGEIGVGIGWMTNTPDQHMVDNSVLGFLQYGIGIKIKTDRGHVFKIGPRFEHRSALFLRDAGMNGYGVMLSVVK